MTRRNRRKRFTPLFGIRALYFIVNNWLIILIIGGLIITGLLMLSSAAQAQDSPYPLYVQPTFADPVQDKRHQELLEQLIKIENNTYRGAIEAAKQRKRACDD